MPTFVTGTLLQSERKTDSGIIEGQELSWDFTVLHVLDDAASPPVIRKLRLPKGVHVHPFANGEHIEVEVQVYGQPKMELVPSALIAKQQKSA